MAEILSNQYKSVFSNPEEELSDMDLGQLPQCDKKLSNIHVDAITVEIALNEIPSNAVAGPDGVGPLFLQKGGDFIVEALMDIMKATISDSTIPQFLRDIWIFPIWFNKKKKQKGL